MQPIGWDFEVLGAEAKVAVHASLVAEGGRYYAVLALAAGKYSNTKPCAFSMGGCHAETRVGLGGFLYLRPWCNYIFCLGRKAGVIVHCVQ